MLLNFIKVDFREDLLIKKYLDLVNSGINPSEILFLVQNSNLKKKISDKILQKININAIEKLQVHSFHSIVYNTLIENWCYIENLIPSDKAFILPNLVGLEVSQFLLKDILKDNVESEIFVAKDNNHYSCHSSQKNCVRIYYQEGSWTEFNIIEDEVFVEV